MRLTYDPDADAAYIFIKDTIAPGEVKSSEICDVEILGSAIILQFDAMKKMIGIEVLGCRALLPEDALRTSD